MYKLVYTYGNDTVVSVLWCLQCQNMCLLRLTHPIKYQEWQDGRWEGVRVGFQSVRCGFQSPIYPPCDFEQVACISEHLFQV